MVLDQEVQELGQPFGLVLGEGGGLRDQLGQGVGIALFEELDNGRGGGNGSMAIVGGLDPVALALESAVIAVRVKTPPEAPAAKGVPHVSCANSRVAVPPVAGREPL
jgi:hypothetical protein